MLMPPMAGLANRFTPAAWADPEVVPFAARVSVWGRWFIVAPSGDGSTRRK